MFLLPEADLLPDLSKTFPCVTAWLWLVLVAPWSSLELGLRLHSLMVKEKDGIQPLHPPHLYLSVIWIILGASAHSLKNGIFQGTGTHPLPHTCQGVFVRAAQRLLHIPKGSALLLGLSKHRFVWTRGFTTTNKPFRTLSSQFMLKCILWHGAEHSEPHSWAPGQTCWEIQFCSLSSLSWNADLRKFARYHPARSGKACKVLCFKCLL